LGSHKWLDRPQKAGWLVVDLDDSVLEAAWANVFALLDGVLVTPPADGRLLPGVTRARLLEAPDVATREQPVALAELRAAEAVLLTSSVRLVTPAGVLAPPSRQAIELADRLRRHPAISRKTDSYIR
ncbi:MAG: aminotransferase class IV, partial [Solirubrobacteraceae bacterium]